MKSFMYQAMFVGTSMHLLYILQMLFRNATTCMKAAYILGFSSYTEVVLGKNSSNYMPINQLQCDDVLHLAVLQNF